MAAAPRDLASPHPADGDAGARLRAAESALARLSRRLMGAQEEERRRLAVELHDELGGILTAAKINLESMSRHTETAVARWHLGQAIEAVDRAMQAVHDLALDLRPAVLDDLGLAAALRWYADRFARTSRLEVELAIDAVADLDPDVATACFRIAQEALTNAARHGRARRVRLELLLEPDGLELRVRDDGVGFDAAGARERALSGGSTGLAGMFERAATFGGELDVASVPGEGTEVRLRFPLRGREEGAPR
jgi:signal transduction histidine kinase